MIKEKKLSCYLLGVLLILASPSLFSQTIDNVTISSNSICKPASVNVTFKVTNGNGSPKHFTNGTNYIVDLGTLSGNTFTIVHTQNYPAPSNFPSAANGASTTLIKTFTIPATVTDGANYQIIISSTNPDAGFTISSLSPIFEIKSKTVSPTVANNGPVCSGNTLSLSSSSVIGATYSWTGPNGYSSNQQNPVVSTSATIAMSGNYSLIITSMNGCSSSPTTTNVVVSSSGGWTGSVNSDWNNSSNWECGMIPNLNTNVVIPSSLTNYPVLNTGYVGTVNNLTLQTGSSLTISNNTLEIAGTISNNGVFNALNGTITLKGSTVQNIPSNTFLNNRIKDLTINNSSNVNLLGNLEVTGVANALAGNLNSGGFLTLISNNTQTALIDGSGNGEILGNVTMQRYLDPAFGYKYFSSPFQNTVVGDYQTYIELTSNFPNFYSYIENRNDGPGRDATGWNPYTTLTNPVNPLEGYALNFGNTATPKTISITGTVNNGNQQINLRNTNGIYTQGFNLVGNPYPSPIDWNAGTGWTKTNIDNAVYFFTASSTDQYVGTYSSYVNGIQSADGNSSNIIPSMQGFFVHVSDLILYPVEATLRMTNEVRINNFNQPFLKSPNIQEYPFIRIASNFENLDLKDYMVIYLNERSTSTFNKDLDALKLMNTDIQVPNLYGLSPKNKKLSIKGLSISEVDPTIIPIGITTKNHGWLRIGLKDIQNIPSNFYVYLIDTKKRIGQNLLERSEYRFFKEGGVEDTRFHLLLSKTAISNPAVAFRDHFSISTVGDNVIVFMNLPAGEKGVLHLNTLTGQNVERILVSGKNDYIINQINSSGIYLFSLNFQNELFTKKIIIKK